MAAYAICDTGGSKQEKVATVSSGSFSLTTGAEVLVKFKNAQIYNGGFTLNVNNTGAKSVMRNGITATARYIFSAGEVIHFVYDGNNYIIVDGALATSTYYGFTKLSSSVSSTSSTTAATPAAVKKTYDLAASKASVVVLTQDEYNALETKDSNTLYCIK